MKFLYTFKFTSNKRFMAMKSKDFLVNMHVNASVIEIKKFIVSF